MFSRKVNVKKNPLIWVHWLDRIVVSMMNDMANNAADSS